MTPIDREQIALPVRSKITEIVERNSGHSEHVIDDDTPLIAVGFLELGLDHRSRSLGRRNFFETRTGTRHDTRKFRLHLQNRERYPQGSEQKTTASRLGARHPCSGSFSSPLAHSLDFLRPVRSGRRMVPCPGSHTRIALRRHPRTASHQNRHRDSPGRWRFYVSFDCPGLRRETKRSLASHVPDAPR